MGMSVKDVTWDPEKKQHSCCGSHHSYHLQSCPNRRDVIPGRASDPLVQKVAAMKRMGMNSGSIARELGIPLIQVNEIYSQL